MPPSRLESAGVVDQSAVRELPTLPGQPLVEPLLQRHRRRHRVDARAEPAPHLRSRCGVTIARAYDADDVFLLTGWVDRDGRVHRGDGVPRVYRTSETSWALMYLDPRTGRLRREPLGGGLDEDAALGKGWLFLLLHHVVPGCPGGSLCRCTDCLETLEEVAA